MSDIDYKSTTNISLNFDNTYQIKRYNIARRYDTGNIVLNFKSKSGILDTPGLHVFLAYRYQNDSKAKYLPIINNSVELSYEFTKRLGEYVCNLIVKSSPVADGTTGFLRSSEIFKLSTGNVVYRMNDLESQDVDPSIKWLYDEILTTIEDLNKKLANGDFSPKISENDTWIINEQDTGKLAIGKSPKIGSNGNWFTFDEDAMEYVDTGVAARGESESVVQKNSYLDFPNVGQSEGKIYIDKSTNTVYRWDDVDKKYYVVSISRIDIINGGTVE